MIQETITKGKKQEKYKMNYIQINTSEQAAHKLGQIVLK